jgi:small subunit ribosomal protein S17
MEKKRKMMVGRVVSDKMTKTVIVAVKKTRHHPLYKKVLRKVVNYKAHDEKSECKLGDLVRIEETRPLSKEKRWRVAEILAKGEVVEVKPTEIEPEIAEVKPQEKIAEK